MKKRELFLFVCRLAVGGLFVVSGYSKLMEPASNFIGAILGYQLVSAQIAWWVAVIMPWVELVVGVFFILGLWFRFSLFLLWGLNTIFLAAIGSTFLRNIPLQNCGCFGEGAHALPIRVTLALDAILFFIFLVMNLKKKDSLAVSLDVFW